MYIGYVFQRTNFFFCLSDLSKILIAIKSTDSIKILYRSVEY